MINSKNQVFGYEQMYVINGSIISANPGVNPSLSITAIAERTMSFFPKKSGCFSFGFRKIGFNGSLNV
ncbi:hypothetical protein HC174_10575 [Salinimicrobium sp. CDJ15-81-2]|nr:hypothetical protein [Salinimicrobium nanhaiense]